MEMPKASDADKDHFRWVLPDHPEVVIKPMFGNLGAFVNGNMFAGLFGPTIGVKLADADKEMLESSERTVPFGPAERPMGGYTGLPEIWNAEGDGDEARGQGVGGEGVRARGRAAAEGTQGARQEGLIRPRGSTRRGTQKNFAHGHPKLCILRIAGITLRPAGHHRPLHHRK